MVSDQYCGSSLLVALPDDALTVVNQFLCPKDVCNLGSCCRTLHGLASSDDIWITQCQKIGILPHEEDLVEWRRGFASYKALYRFLASVEPLIGFWVHQNPELGNVVYVMPGFLSVVGCRIVPQEIGLLGMAGGPILWTPVFEIIADFDGSAVFFLHGREGDVDYLYSGSFRPDGKACNVVSLEVESRLQSNGTNVPSVPFNRLKFGDRRKLLDTVTCKIRFKVPDSTSGLLFPCLRSDEEIVLLWERRSFLIHSYKQGGDCSDFRSTLDGGSQSAKVAGYFGRLKEIFGKSSLVNNGSSSDNKHAELREFLRSGDAIGLTLKASTKEFSNYRGWPYMDDEHIALYKMRVQVPKIGHEYAGLWGATYGWPPGRSTGDKPGKALYFLVLSYKESQGQRLLIATKILEGNKYVRHPNGSVMFTVNIDEVSLQPFPWDADVLHAFSGEGITKGYGFRFPNSHPGSLYVIQDGLLAFVWEQSESVMTLQRLDLPELLKKGEQIPALTPVLNFSYSGLSHRNVFT